MKRYLAITIIILILILWELPVKAASFSIRASKTQVQPNETFTITVGGECIGRVNINVSNGTTSTSSVWVEENYKTVTITAGGSGSVTVTATPVVGFSDSDANEYNPGARSVTVQIEQASTNTPSNTNSVQTPANNNKPTTNPQTPKYEDTRSTNNMLSSISTNIGNLSPEFNTNTSEYTVQLPKEATSIIINATASDNKARINGVGEIKVEPGDNVIVITVIAENGAERKYTINAYVDETPQVYLKYKEKNIGVVRNLKGVNILEGFNEAQHTIDNNTIKIFNNGKFSIIYGINEQNEKNFYIVDTTKNECTSKIIPIIINNQTFYLVDIENEKQGFEKTTVTINNIETIGYKVKEGFESYFLLSVMNNQGEMIDYLYETKENTLQLYSQFAPITYEEYQGMAKITDKEYQKLVQKSNIIQIALYIISTLLVISVIYIIIIIMKRRSRDKSSEEKSDEEIKERKGRMP